LAVGVKKKKKLSYGMQKTKRGILFSTCKGTYCAAKRKRNASRNPDSSGEKRTDLSTGLRRSRGKGGGSDRKGKEPGENGEDSSASRALAVNSKLPKRILSFLFPTKRRDAVGGGVREEKGRNNRLIWYRKKRAYPPKAEKKR